MKKEPSLLPQQFPAGLYINKGKETKINSIIVDREQDNSFYLRKCLLSNFPGLQIHGEASSYAEANRLIKNTNPSLVFLDADTIRSNAGPDFRDGSASGFELVYISYRAEDAIHAIRQGACGFLLKPLNVSDIVTSVEDAIHKITNRIPNKAAAETDFSSSRKPIGIPTMDGIEFLNVNEIIRCEGLQKCTRIVTSGKNSLVSSYSIGEFKKLLDDFGFFSCHKSHLINLTHVRKLTREGFIVMTDNIAVPLARRKRFEFLQSVRHL